MVVVRCTTLNQHGEAVQTFTPKLVVPRRVKADVPPPSERDVVRGEAS
jgi:hypothetical protein